jgi:hypothetical protein
MKFSAIMAVLVLSSPAWAQSNNPSARERFEAALREKQAREQQAALSRQQREARAQLNEAAESDVVRAASGQPSQAQEQLADAVAGNEQEPAAAAQDESAPPQATAPNPYPTIVTVSGREHRSFNREAKQATCRMLNDTSSWGISLSTPASSIAQLLPHAQHIDQAGIRGPAKAAFSVKFDEALTGICNNDSLLGEAFQEALERSWQRSCDEAFYTRDQRVPFTNRAVYNSNLFKCRRAYAPYGSMAYNYSAGFKRASIENEASPAAADCGAGVNDSEAPRAPVAPVAPVTPAAINESAASQE